MGRGTAAARSLLFVPASSPGRFRRAAETGAHGIIIDLEDAVAPLDKAEAREHAQDWMRSGGTPVVRINSRGTPWYEDDLEMVAGHGCPVMLPKVDTAEDVYAVRRVLATATELIVLVESASAIMNIAEICQAEGVTRAAFGSFDLGAEIGVDPDNHEALIYARSALVLASAAAGLAAPLDGVTASIDDDTVLAADVHRARVLGFGGKLCIHPAQVNVINGGFRPSADEFAWAREVLLRSADGGVAVLNGKMIDAPVIERARRIEAMAD